MAAAEITFDKLVYIDRLKSAGFDEPQARAQAEALDQALRDSVATKNDLRAVRDEIKDLRVEMRSEIARFENKIASAIVRLENKIDLVARDLTIRKGGMLILLFGALASLKFFG